MGIKRITLPLNTFSFSTPKPLSENITQFLFNSSNDERLSEHAFRNEIAITQFEDDVELGNNSFRNKPIWYKKLFYKHGYTLGNTAESQTPIHQSLKILLIDDMGDKWKPALLNMLPKSEIVVCKSVSDAKQKIKELNDSVVLRRNDFNKKINNLLSSNTEINDKKG
ncbi:MAG: hypothetical protein IPP73_10220 [Chitinophagaceae bacterium]|nr:hypothetical protein [Chitinophagaceae bacterium]